MHEIDRNEDYSVEQKRLYIEDKYQVFMDVEGNYWGRKGCVGKCHNETYCFVQLMYDNKNLLNICS